jgi:hypothetical protein
MTVLRGFLIVIASGLGFGAVGAGIGFGIGRTLPDFYRALFRFPPDVRLHPEQLGTALGLTQGLLVGLAIGAVIVLAVAWYNGRAAQFPQGSSVK